MSRSKKNWDFLVKSDGTYYDLSKGVSGPKGDVGTPGNKGDKGSPGLAYSFKGEVPTFGDLPLADPSNESHVYKVADTGKFYASNGSSWTEIPGATAIKGEQGLKGELGDKGEQGIKGEEGAVGPKGEIGEKGSEGVKGDQGIEGEKGDKGEGAQGIKGEEGEKGEEGIKGIEGEKGDEGEKGRSSPTFTYKGEVSDFASLPTSSDAGDVYKTSDDGKFFAWNGTDWDELPGITALKGEKGEIGEKGDDGQKGEPSTVKGDKGEIGQKGEVGQKGDKGIDGDEGVKGFKGDQGPKGEIGEKGEKGEEGEKGEKGEKGQKGFWVDPDKYYDKGEVDSLLTGYFTKGEAYSKGEVTDLLIAYYTKGEMDVVLSDYYTKGETYDRAYIDAKDNNRYTKGEVDALIEANAGTEYEYTVVPGSDQTATLQLKNLKDDTLQSIPIQATSQVGLSVQGGTIVIGENLTAPLNYRGPIEAPTDPSTLDATPADGHFLIYTVGGTAWNGDTVSSGDWAIYDEGTGWQNINQDIDIGVTSVDVSGGILSLEGTASDPIINLEADDLEAACDARYLRLDGTNNYQAPSLSLTNSGGTVIDAIDGLSLAYNTISYLRLSLNTVEILKNLNFADGYTVNFGGTAVLDLSGNYRGNLSHEGTPILTWSKDGILCSKYIGMQNNRITSLAQPIEGSDAATKTFVLDNQFTLNPATPTDLGGIKVGNGLAVTVDGTLSTVDTGEYLRLAGGTMTGPIVSESTTALDIARDNGGALTNRYINVRATNKLRLAVFPGQDNDGWKSVLDAHWNDTNGNPELLLNYIKDPTSAGHAVNKRYLEQELAKVSGAELATKTIAGTLKVNVTSSEVDATDTAYRNSDGHLYVMKATTGTSNNSTTGTQRGVAAFHSDSFSASNGFITLKAATSSKLGGVKASSSASDRSSAFCIDSDGTGKIRNATSSTIGVSKMGQICTKSGSLSSSDYVSGQMVLRTDNNSVYIKV